MSGKIETYLGFARRAGKLIAGVNAVKASGGRIFLLVADRSASENTKKEIAKLKSRFSCPLAEVGNLEEITGKPLCKLAAVCEEHLAGAILREINQSSSVETEEN